MAIVDRRDIDPKHVDLVHRLSNFLCRGGITSGEVVDACSALIGIVLINSIDSEVECLEVLNEVADDIEELIRVNWPLAAASRSLAKTSKGNH